MDEFTWIFTIPCQLKDKFFSHLGYYRAWKRIDKCIYIYITESLCCTPDTTTTLLINYTPI